MLGSCQNVRQLSIDYMQPADVSFPNTLKRVAIVNNAPANDASASAGSDQRQEADDMPQQPRRYQGNAAITAESLAQALAEESYFDEVIICDSALQEKDRPLNAAQPLSTDEVNRLVNSLNVDFLISLEDIQLSAQRKISFLPDWDMFYGTIDVKVFPTVRVYLPNRKNPMVTISPNDSIFWEEAGNSERDINARLIGEQEMIDQASEFAGTLPVKHLLPSWKTATRYLFCGGSVNMRDAAVYAQEGNWESAIELWKAQYESKQGKKKMQAAYNIAVGYEMQDDIDSALQWAQKAFRIAMEIDKADDGLPDKETLKDKPNYILTALYVNELQERQNSIKLLDLQMNRFEVEQ